MATSAGPDRRQAGAGVQAPYQVVAVPVVLIVLDDEATRTQQAEAHPVKNGAQPGVLAPAGQSLRVYQAQAELTVMAVKK